MSWPSSLERQVDPTTAGLHHTAAASSDRTGGFATGAITIPDDGSGVPISHMLGWLVAGSIGWATIISGVLMALDVVR